MVSADGPINFCEYKLKGPFKMDKKEQHKLTSKQVFKMIDDAVESMQGEQSAAELTELLAKPTSEIIKPLKSSKTPPAGRNIARRKST